MTQEIPGEDILQQVSPPSERDLLAEADRPSRRHSPGRQIGLATVGLLLLATLGFYGMQSHASKPDSTSSDRKAQITPVTVVTVMQKTVPVQLQAIGNVQAENTISVTPQIGGQITGVYFQKGQEVSKGQLLFTLDDRTALAGIQQAQGTLARDRAQVQQSRATLARDLTAVKQAQATLAKDAAQARYARATAARYQALYQQGVVSLDQVQQYAANSQADAATLQADQEAIANARATIRGDLSAIENAEAVVTADEGALKNAQVQLSYTKIYAPIDGRAGDILVNQGNVVQANSTNPLVKITQVHPIEVSFSVPESNLAEIQKYQQNGRLPVAVTFPNSNPQPLRGSLSFINNTVDNTTGTIQLMGEFANEDGQLVPGQYVNATLTLTTQPNATVVPSQAVQNGPNGQFVFVVQPDLTVTNVPVTITNTVAGLAVVQKGVNPGDRVVTDGQANLVSGSKIQIKSALGTPANNINNSPGSNPAQPGHRRHLHQNADGGPA